MNRFNFPAIKPNPALEELRSEVQAFLLAEKEAGYFHSEPECWMSSSDPEFSRKMGARGWIGMNWKGYGGHNRSALERYIVTEETLRFGAPVGAHWIADRQHAPMLIEHGTEAQKADILPRIAAGECYFAIGLSEPGAGSDLAAVKTKAEKLPDGTWKLNGQKIWSSGAQHAHYMVSLVRTSPPDGRNRHVGLSQVLIDMSAHGVSVRPISDLAGDAHFNEVTYDDVILPADALLGEEGGGWQQVTSELAMERSGPERFLSSYVTLEQAVIELQGKMSSSARARLGLIYANLRTLRGMSFGIAKLLEQGVSPETEAALVKDLGNSLENKVTQNVRAMIGELPINELSDTMKRIINIGVLRSPPNSLRGGTTEVMRGIIARQLGLR